MEGAALPRGSTVELTPLSYPGPGGGSDPMLSWGLPCSPVVVMCLSLPWAIHSIDGSSDSVPSVLFYNGAVIEN